LTNIISIGIVSVDMKKLIDLYTKIQKFEKQQEGIFTTNELSVLFDINNPMLLNKRINQLLKNGYLKKFIRGFYITDGFNIELLSRKINPDSYISFGNILAKEMVIGTVPKFTLYCVKPGRKRVYKNKLGTIIYLTILEKLFFGFECKNGINYAIKEKALLDTLYFYQKGIKYSFNIFQDINLDLIDKNKVMLFLKKYKNPKFIQFVKRYLYAQN